jgi:hypothetical protein
MDSIPAKEWSKEWDISTSLDLDRQQISKPLQGGLMPQPTNPVNNSEAGIIIIEGKPYRIDTTVSQHQLQALGKLLQETGGKLDASAEFEVLIFIRGKAYNLVPQ